MNQNSESQQNTNPDAESNFQYSVDESNFEIPEFMKNDLERLKKQTEMLNIEEEGDAPSIFEEEVKETKQGKIRNSIYFIISRGIKFGQDTDLANYMLNQCFLIQKVIKDLSI